ncbi:enamine deaminase RidA (YjgF/YER057c/UK114 family) [Saccharothrix tamanrassetensis]|uniref:Enamine deaminase RidA (YjgF/YER057c/UK114 family) n=1 Tax=Saccharothrix tamanrassetensis TaxID=1051531 RepID=A0A841C8D6_9PSEU|nr:RidA family protein [Saccharothrix tamanrassetensis]MBB5953669.1 enamine deaminase RidA (YjgF/YER057c/UK114 family) [Saccharothrix tamanrassetensis]
MPHDIINPEGLHDPVGFGYSHVAATSGDVVFIAGQYASGPDGQVVSDDFAEQVRQSLANLGTALRAVGLDFGHVVRLGSYIVDHDQDKLEVWSRAVGEVWGAEPPAQTLLGVATLALPGMKFEVDAVAVRP